MSETDGLYGVLALQSYAAARSASAYDAALSTGASAHTLPFAEEFAESDLSKALARVQRTGSSGPSINAGPGPGGGSGSGSGGGVVAQFHVPKGRAQAVVKALLDATQPPPAPVRTDGGASGGDLSRDAASAQAEIDALRDALATALWESIPVYCSEFTAIPPLYNDAAEARGEMRIGPYALGPVLGEGRGSVVHAATYAPLGDDAATAGAAGVGAGDGTGGSVAGSAGGVGSVGLRSGTMGAVSAGSSIGDTSATSLASLSPLRRRRPGRATAMGASGSGSPDGKQRGGAPGIAAGSAGPAFGPGAAASTAAAAAAAAVDADNEEPELVPIVIKVVDKYSPANRSVEAVKRVNSEIRVLRVLRHDNIVRLFDVIATRRRIYLVMERAGGTLEEYARARTSEGVVARSGSEHAGAGAGAGAGADVVEDSPAASTEAWTQSLVVAMQVLRAVAECHRQRMAHCDINAATVRVTPPATHVGPAAAPGDAESLLPVVKLIHFGGASKYGEGLAALRGPDPRALANRGYIAPERVSTPGKYHGAAADSWSVGCVFLRLCLGTRRWTQLWLSAYEPSQYAHAAEFAKAVKAAAERCVAEVESAPAFAHVDASFKAAVRQCLSAEPSRRPAMASLLTAPCFAALVPRTTPAHVPVAVMANAGQVNPDEPVPVSHGGGGGGGGGLPQGEVRVPVHPVVGRLRPGAMSKGGSGGGGGGVEAGALAAAMATVVEEREQPDDAWGAPGDGGGGGGRRAHMQQQESFNSGPAPPAGTPAVSEDSLASSVYSSRHGLGVGTPASTSTATTSAVGTPVARGPVSRRAAPTPQNSVRDLPDMGGAAGGGVDLTAAAEKAAAQLGPRYTIPSSSAAGSSNPHASSAAALSPAASSALLASTPMAMAGNGSDAAAALQNARIPEDSSYMSDSAGASGMSDVRAEVASVLERRHSQGKAHAQVQVQVHVAVHEGERGGDGDGDLVAEAARTQSGGGGGGRGKPLITPSVSPTLGGRNGDLSSAGASTLAAAETVAGAMSRLAAEGQAGGSGGDGDGDGDGGDFSNGGARFGHLNDGLQLSPAQAGALPPSGDGGDDDDDLPLAVRLGPTSPSGAALTGLAGAAGNGTLNGNLNGSGSSAASSSDGRRRRSHGIPVLDELPEGATLKAAAAHATADAAPTPGALPHGHLADSLGGTSTTIGSDAMSMSVPAASSARLSAMPGASTAAALDDADTPPKRRTLDPL